MAQKTINSWDWDIRVRERNLKSGLLTDKDIEKHKASLADLEGQADAVSLHQPALDEPPHDLSSLDSAEDDSVDDDVDGD